MMLLILRRKMMIKREVNTDFSVYETLQDTGLDKSFLQKEVRLNKALSKVSKIFTGKAGFSECAE